MSDDEKKPETSLQFIFQLNAEIPRGKVGVRPMGDGKFYVTARDKLDDAQIVMAIARFVAKHDPAPPDPSTIQ